MSVTVKNDASLELLEDLKVGLNAVNRESLVADVDTGNIHVASGQGRGLAGEDVNDLAGGLKSAEVLDKKVLFLKLVNGECHGHGDDERHTFGDADNEESEGGRGELDGFLEGPAANEFVVAHAHLDEPDDGEEEEGNHGNVVCVDTNNLGEDSELVLEGSHVVLNGESVLGTSGLLDLLLLEGVLTDGEDDGLAGSAHDDGVLKKDGVGVGLNVFFAVLVGALLGGSLGSIHVREVLLLVNVHIHFFDKEAVSGDAIALLKEDDVTDDEVLDVDGLGSAVLASEDGHFLAHNFLAQFEELFLFAPVTDGLDGAGKKHGEED